MADNELENEMGNAIIADTNVYIHDPRVVDFLREGGNTLFVPWTVVNELDHLKNRPDIGFDAIEAITKIEKLRDKDESSIVIAREKNFGKFRELDKSNPDHQIIATAIKIAADNQNTRPRRFKEVKLISRDHTVRLIARELKLREKYSLSVEDYYRDNTEESGQMFPKEINVPASRIFDGQYFRADEFSDLDIVENEGVICNSDAAMPGFSTNEWGKKFAAIKKGDLFKIIPANIKAMGLYPQTLNGDGLNWSQVIAMGQLMDPSIHAVFLQGQAGTGKTLLALATAIEQRSSFYNIVISRPMVHLDDEDNMGFLPGTESDKMAPWKRPIKAALSFIKMVDKERNFKLIEEMEKNEKIMYESLDFIRGMTYFKCVIIIDEAQNLTPHQMKTYVTRAGLYTKMVFTGDLSQIDRRKKLDRRSSGLNYALNRLRGRKIIGICNLKETVRSPLAALGSELL